MKQKDVARNYKYGVFGSAILTFLFLIIAVLFPSFMTFIVGGKSTRLFGIILTIGGVYSFFKKESYSVKPSLKNISLVKLFPASVFALPSNAFRRHTGWKTQIWSIVVVALGIFLTI